MENSQLPRYVYDPVTQSYKLMTPQEEAEAKKKRGLGGLYDAGGTGDVTSPGPGPSMTDPGMAEMGVEMQNIALDLKEVPSLVAQAAAAGLKGISTGVMGMAEQIPVAQPSPIIVSPIAPTQTANLQAMNAGVGGNGPGEEDDGPEGVVSVGPLTMESITDAVDATTATDATSTSTDGTSTDGGPGGGGPGGTDGPGGGGPGGDPDGNGSEGSGWYKGGQIMTYAQGGIADAYKTQSMGRGPDTMLVHMSPREVQGLQALAMAHGGSLTINPKTGLPEAGFLDSILPTVAGAALMMVPGMQPLAAAALVGGGTALMTGDLGKGFMAGLGAFGGAGIGSALGAAGAAAPAATGQAATLAAAPETSAAIMQSTTGAANAGMLNQAPYLAIPAETGTVMAPVASGTGLPMYEVNAFTGGVNTAIPPNFTPTGTDMMTGIKSLGTEAGRNQVMQNLGGTTGALKTAGMAAAPLLAGGLGGEEEGDLKKQQTYIRPYKYDAGRKTEEPEFKYRTGAPGESTSELTYFSPTFTAQPVQRYEDYMSQNMAGGGIASMAKGRYLKGAGDGMSDDIPATIEGGQPARLADGEFVVPADVVSHLGNGSSNAGAKKLYKMMDRIRTARTGKKRQAPEVKTDRYMPA